MTADRDRTMQMTGRPWESELVAPNGRLVRENFVAWFGDSKVVDADGSPLTVFHGCARPISAFDANQTMDGCFWFSADRDKIARGESGASSSGHVMAVMLSAQRLAGWDEYERLTIDQLIASGFDGVKLDDDYIVFEPTQVKAVDNSGLFLCESPSVGDRAAAMALERSVRAQRCAKAAALGVPRATPEP